MIAQTELNKNQPALKSTSNQNIVCVEETDCFFKERALNPRDNQKQNEGNAIKIYDRTH